jgi:hypothetical protein
MPTTQLQVDTARNALPGLAVNKVTTTQDLVAKSTANTSAKNAWTQALATWQNAVTALAGGTGSQATVDAAFDDLTVKEALYTAAAQALALANTAKAQAVTAFDAGVSNYTTLVQQFAVGN